MIKWLDDVARRFMWVAYSLIAASLVSVGWFAADRVPPFVLLGVEPAAASAGEVIIIRARVWRDASRDCSVSFTRYIYDSRGVRFDGAELAKASDAMIDTMERRDPGRLTVAIVVPAAAAPGPATLQTVLWYACNKVHHIWPIYVTTDMAFTVLP